MSVRMRKMPTVEYVKSRFEYDGLRFGGEKNSNFLDGAECKNCLCENGVLSTGAGLEDYVTYDGNTVSVSSIKRPLKEVKSFRVHRRGYEFGEKMLLMTTNSIVYVYDPDSDDVQRLTQFGTRTKTVFGMDADNEVYAFFCGPVGVWSYDENGTLNEMTENANCGIACWYADRLFFVQQPYAISFTPPCEPLNVQAVTGESGKMEVPSEFGEIVGFGALKDFLYVFTAQGILRMRVRDGVENFALEEVGYDGGKIFYDSVISGSGHILFLASDGLYLFDGHKAEKVCSELEIRPMRENQEVSGVYTDGFFYMQYVDVSGEVKRVCLSSDGKTAYFAFAADALSDGGGKGFCVQDNMVKMLSRNGDLPKNEKYYFRSKNLAFGSEKRKTLTKLTIYGEKSCKVSVTADGVEKVFSVVFENGVASVPVRMVGRSFSLTFTLEKSGKIRRVAADVVALKRK